jgi:glutaredoxin
MPRARLVTVLTLYSRPGCHLCDDMKAVVSRVTAGMPEIAVDEVDISSDPTLEARYGLEIPVLVIAGKKAAKYRIDEAALRRLLREHCRITGS